MDDEITSVQFLPNCDAYYNAAIGVAWDLDRNGSFETLGPSSTLSAVGLDGSSVLGVPVRAEHPTDPTPLGASDVFTTTVTVKNVVPSVSGFSITDPLGNQVGSDVPFVLAGVELTASASFTDPGTPDTQTASLSWADGSLDRSFVFDSFSDAFGGATGALSHRHVYGQAGGHFVVLSVVDDDGGTTQVTTVVDVVSPEDAMQWVIDQIQAAAEADPAVVEILQAALDELENNDVMAVLVKVEAVLAQARSTGTDVTALQDVLGMVAQSLTRDVLDEATSAVDPPSRGEQKQLGQIETSIESGHIALLARGYLEAIEHFQVAVGRAIKLIP